MRLFCMDTQAQPLALLPEAGLRVRRLVPAQGPARHHPPRARARTSTCRCSSSMLRSNELHVQARDRTRSSGSSARSGSACSACRSRPRPTTCARARSCAWSGRWSARATSCCCTTTHVDVAQLVGANRAFLEARDPVSRARCSARPREVVEGSEVIVIAQLAPGLSRGAAWLSDDQIAGRLRAPGSSRCTSAPRAVRGPRLVTRTPAARVLILVENLHRAVRPARVARVAGR